MNNICNDYDNDTRLEITDEILPMVEDEEYVIIFGNSHYGRSTLLKRLIIEEGGVFFLSIETINWSDGWINASSFTYFFSQWLNGYVQLI